MQPGQLKLKFKMKRDQSCERSSLAHESECVMDGEQSNQNNPTFHVDVCVERREVNSTEIEDDQPSENANKQLILYEPPIKTAEEILPAPMKSERLPSRRYSFPGHTPRVMPAVAAFTVQCANCFKWRLIPTKEKYEEIREHILQQPFLCETAREWRPSISCADEPDIVQDDSRLWAIDKPNIAQPPAGWQRILKIRGEGSSKFADVYYESPSGKRFRSMVEIQKYLQENPEYVEAGVTMLQFSFQIPKPLQENYVRKRPVRSTTSLGDNGGWAQGFDETSEVSPLAWAGPDEDTGIRLGGSEPSPAHFYDLDNEPAKKKRTTKKIFESKQLDHSSQVNLEGTFRL